MRVRCDVCGLYRGAKPHSGALHARIRANRERFRRGLGAFSRTGLRRRRGAHK
jgi:hypothetical protein